MVLSFMKKRSLDLSLPKDAINMLLKNRLRMKNTGIIRLQVTMGDSGNNVMFSIIFTFCQSSGHGEQVFFSFFP